MESIEFEGKKYPMRFVEITFDGTTSVESVSILSLEKKLITKDFGDWVSDEAEYVDEQIFFYVQDKKIHFSNSELKKIIEDSIC